MHNSEKNIDRDPFFYPKFIFITLKHYTKVIFWYQLSNYNFSIFLYYPKISHSYREVIFCSISIPSGMFWDSIKNEVRDWKSNFFFNLVNKGHKVDIFNKEISSIDFFCSRTERVKVTYWLSHWQTLKIFVRRTTRKP